MSPQSKYWGNVSPCPVGIDAPDGVVEEPNFRLDISSGVYLNAAGHAVRKVTLRVYITEGKVPLHKMYWPLVHLVTE